MEELAGLEWWALMLLAFVVIGGSTWIALVLLRRFHHPDPDCATRAGTHAGPLMPTLGALFAFLSAFTIATEWGMQTQANAVVTDIATSSSQLAWAATAPGVDTDAIQASLVIELEEISGDGWRALEDGNTAVTTETVTFGHLQRTVRDNADRIGVSTANSTELISAIDSLASARRSLGSSAKQLPPTLLFVALLATGLVLCVNAVTLTLGTTGRSTTVVVGIVAVVAIDIALLLIMAGPFRGTITTSPAPIDRVVHTIDAGYFRR